MNGFKAFKTPKNHTQHALLVSSNIVLPKSVGRFALFETIMITL